MRARGWSGTINRGTPPMNSTQRMSAPTQSASTDGGALLSEMLPDEKAPGPDEIIFNEAESELLARLVDSLDPREATILRLRYGLDDEEEAMTLKDIGTRIGLTRERVRQIEAEALRKLHKTLSEQSE